MSIKKLDPENVFAVYVDSMGDEHSQPVCDIPLVGTLIDPHTDEDMEVAYVEVVEP